MRERILRSLLRTTVSILIGGAVDLASAAPLTAADLARLGVEVRVAETAFAKTMADRRLDQFEDFVAQDAVFDGGTLRVGRESVVEKWRNYFKDPVAPFSWSVDAVTVTADGSTAVSTGPVRGPGGRMIARFTSIWRKEADGRWRVIADQGVDACECTASAKTGD